MLGEHNVRSFPAMAPQVDTCFRGVYPELNAALHTHSVLCGFIYSHPISGGGMTSYPSLDRSSFQSTVGVGLQQTIELSTDLYDALFETNLAYHQ